ncbi:PH domain-containing protein [Flagellimonas zhangzhouensis]|uniref:PH domain-containing protein n=1 Tax=Flagellimonas zhangzhouensis TaxID=1073328 RepID=A0A1H2R1A2_9FLAO|nr:PH domain-containing protein [Allomuricauda zhangzhouensis]SDQ58721.1 PH domain-containing protein [Allomuricauda zhangzhouensis]SDW13167.1 PH domain-containing protein [Allomuricauda zhangzhouensis]
MLEKRQHNNLKEHNSQTVVYPARVGMELVLPVILIFGFIIVNTFESSSVLELIIQFAILFLIVGLFFSISYEINGDVLTITTLFFFKKNILVTDITRVVESFNPLSSPAPSLRRLEIYYGKYSSTLISPKDKLKFIGHLKQISPTIQVELREKKK